MNKKNSNTITKKNNKRVLRTTNERCNHLENNANNSVNKKQNSFATFTNVLKRWKISNINNEMQNYNPLSNVKIPPNASLAINDNAMTDASFIREPTDNSKKYKHTRLTIPKTCFYDFLSQVPETIISLTNTQKNEILINYKKVSSLEEMQTFCMDSTSVYLKMCMLLAKYTKTSDHEKCEIHHIFPKFLLKTTNLDQKQIFIHYNEVRVPRDIHMYLHVLRYQEFNDTYDSLCVYLTLGQSIQHTKNKNLQQLVKEIAMKLNHNNCIFEDIQKQQLLVASYGGRKSALGRSDKHIISMLSKPLIWQNSIYHISACFINAHEHINTITCVNDESLLKHNLILRDYVYILMKHLPKEHHPQNWECEKNLKKWVRSLKNYLAGNSSQTTTFLGWELVTICSNIEKSRENAKIKQSLKTTKKENLNLLKAENYAWYNIYFPNNLPEIEAKNKQFRTISEIADCLLSLFQTLTNEQRERKKLNNVLYKYFQEKKPTTMSQINRRFSKVFSKKRSSAYNWCVKFK